MMQRSTRQYMAQPPGSLSGSNMSTTTTPDISESRDSTDTNAAAIWPVPLVLPVNADSVLLEAAACSYISDIHGVSGTSPVQQWVESGGEQGRGGRVAHLASTPQQSIRRQSWGRRRSQDRARLAACGTLDVPALQWPSSCCCPRCQGISARRFARRWARCSACCRDGACSCNRASRGEVVRALRKGRVMLYASGAAQHNEHTRRGREGVWMGGYTRR